MRTYIKAASSILATFFPLVAVAQGFLPYGGVTGNSHFAVETVVSGFVATESAVLSHGSLPAVSTYTGGVAGVSADGTEVSMRISRDGGSIAVNGPAKEYGYEIFAIDGRRLVTGAVSDGSISLAGLASGQYLIRLSCGGSYISGYNFIKRD